eukprot:5633782-Pleurochrysis_carterae.AAC.2
MHAHSPACAFSSVCARVDTPMEGRRREPDVPVRYSGTDDRMHYLCWCRRLVDLMILGGQAAKQLNHIASVALRTCRCRFARGDISDPRVSCMAIGFMTKLCLGGALPRNSLGLADFKRKCSDVRVESSTARAN